MDDKEYIWRPGVTIRPEETGKELVAREIHNLSKRAGELMI